MRRSLVIIVLPVLLLLSMLGLGATSPAHGSNGGTWEQLGFTIPGPSEFAKQEGASLNGNGDVIALGAPRHGNDGGMARVFHWTGSSWEPKGSPLLGAPGSRFGGTVALNKIGDVLAVSAWEANEVSVHRFENGNWTQLGATISAGPTTSAGPNLGSPNVAIDDSGTRVMISWSYSEVDLNGNGTIERPPDGPYNPCALDLEDEVGAVQVWKWEPDNGNWVQMGETLLGTVNNDAYGQEFDISGDGSRIVISTPQFPDPCSGVRGRFEIRRWNGTTWADEAHMSGEAGLEHQLGYSVAMNSDGSTVAVGAIGVNEDKGSVIIGRRLGTQWNFSPELDGVSDDQQLGWSVSLSDDGERLGVVSYNNGDDFAEVFRYDGAHWVALGDRYDQFSMAVLSGDGNTLGLSTRRTYNGVDESGFATVRRLVNSSTPTPPSPSPVFVPTTVGLDPHGGTCTDGGQQSATWRLTFHNVARVPGPGMCSRSGHDFVGWASATDPTTVLPLDLVIDHRTGVTRYLLESRVDLVAVWRAIATHAPVTDLTVFANFLCGPCTNAWLLFTMPVDATDFEVRVNDSPATCTQKGTFFELSLCEITGLTPGPTTFTVTPLNDTTPGVPATVSVTMRP